MVFVREPFSFDIILKKNASEHFAVRESAFEAPPPLRYSTIVRQNGPPAKLRFRAFSYVPTCRLEKKKTRCCLKPTFFHQTSLGATWHVFQIHTKSHKILYESVIHTRWRPRRFGGKTLVSNSDVFFFFQACMWEHRKMHRISIWRVVISTYDCWISWGWGWWKCSFSKCENFRCVFSKKCKKKTVREKTKSGTEKWPK